MAEDFTPRKPEVQLYWGPIDEQYDYKDRSKSQGFWLSDKLTSKGNQSLHGNNKEAGIRRSLYIADGWKLVRADGDDTQDEPDW